MGYRTYSQNIKGFYQFYISMYMVYNQNVAKSSCGRFDQHHKIENINRL
jgi:hypothetical protein